MNLLRGCESFAPAPIHPPFTRCWDGWQRLAAGEGDCKPCVPMPLDDWNRIGG
ncbi:hypothetical protein WCLP8_670016 [uncultured Gammaproteobacteria bacterium]